MSEQMQVARSASEGAISSEVRLAGVPISPGLGMGKVRVMDGLIEAQGEAESITPGQVDGELARIRAAFTRAHDELSQSSRRIEEQFSPALANIFHAHEMLLDSIESSGRFEQELRQTMVSAEAAVRRVFHGWQERFLALRDETFRQRAEDIADLGRKVLRHLNGDHACPLGQLPPGTVLVFRKLLPSDVVPLSPGRVAALVVESLGRGSHAALLACGKSIPTVSEFPGLLEQVHSGLELLVDGYRGEIVLSPASDTRAEFAVRFDKYKSAKVRCEGLCREVAHTMDGHSVRVEANVGEFADVESALDHGADGVGLFRIEALYFTRSYPPTEEELAQELRTLTTPLRHKPLTLRLLDAGGDKPIPFLRLPVEPNPVLGRRGVRLLREYSQMTRTQLAAFLRLAQEQPIRILVPMVTLEEDILAIRSLYDALCAELNISKPPPFGAMIETPAAALSLPDLAPHVDFFSIGTNDLTQYTLAVDRDDPAVSRYFQDSHAAVLRLLRLIIADAGGKPLSVCGELAGREEVIPQLLAMGFRSFSVAPSLIPATKEIVRSQRIGPDGAL